MRSGRLRAASLALVILAVACSVSPADHYERGAAAAAGQDWATARAEFDAAGPYQDAHQRSLDALLAEADQREKAGDLDDALVLLQTAGTYRDADQHAKQLAGTRTVLAVLYGQMTQAAQTNDWGSALGLSGQVLSIAPGFRDVKAKRAEYLDEVYSLASGSIAQTDWPHAVALLTVLVHAEPGYKDAQEQLAQAQIARRKPLAGSYAFGEEIGDGNWYGEVKRIAVGPDGRLTVYVHWTNEDTDVRPARCGADRGGGVSPEMIFPNGTRTQAIETWCSALPDQLVPDGETFEESVTFPAIADGTAPFRIDWYGLPVTGRFVLVH